jgi:predicted component of type VI protein secretion system
MPKRNHSAASKKAWRTRKQMQQARNLDRRIRQQLAALLDDRPPIDHRPQDFWPAPNFGITPDKDHK